MMANMTECDLQQMMAVHEDCVDEEPPLGYWEQPGMVEDRDNVDGLIDLSEENFWRDQQERSTQNHCPSGWEQAVQGWGSASAAAYGTLQRRGNRKPRNGVPDPPHCLLCVDMRLPDLESSAVVVAPPPESHRSAEEEEEPHTQPRDTTGLHNTTPSPPPPRLLLNTSGTHTGAASALALQSKQQTHPDCLVLNDLRKATHHLFLDGGGGGGDGSTVAERRLVGVESLSQHVAHHHQLPSKYHRLLRSSKATGNNNILLSINSFTVLPPVVQSPQLLRPAQQEIAGTGGAGGQICHVDGEPPGPEHNISREPLIESDNITTTSREAAARITGDERGTVTRVGGDTSYSAAAFNSNGCPSCQHNQNHHHHRHLLSAFSVCVPAERYEVSLIPSLAADTAPRSTYYATGRHLKQAPGPARSNGYGTRPARQIAAGVTSQLPMLCCGTKVPMRASAHRLL